MQKMIQNDGGKGDFEEVAPEKLGIWSTLLEGNADATWVFSGWEGCAAALAGVELHEFKLSQYGYKYYSSFLIRSIFLFSFLCILCTSTSYVYQEFELTHYGYISLPKLSHPSSFPLLLHAFSVHLHLMCIKC